MSRQQKIVKVAKKTRYLSIAEMAKLARDKDLKNFGYQTYLLFKKRKLTRKLIDGVYCYRRAA